MSSGFHSNDDMTRIALPELSAWHVLLRTFGGQSWSDDNLSHQRVQPLTLPLRPSHPSKSSPVPSVSFIDSFTAAAGRQRPALRRLVELAAAPRPSPGKTISPRASSTQHFSRSISTFGVSNLTVTHRRWVSHLPPGLSASSQNPIMHYRCSLWRNSMKRLTTSGQRCQGRLGKCVYHSPSKHVRLSASL